MVDKQYWPPFMHERGKKNAKNSQDIPTTKLRVIREISQTNCQANNLMRFEKKKNNRNHRNCINVLYLHISLQL